MMNLCYITFHQQKICVDFYFAAFIKIIDRIVDPSHKPKKNTKTQKDLRCVKLRHGNSCDKSIGLVTNMDETDLKLEDLAPCFP